MGPVMVHAQNLDPVERLRNYLRLEHLLTHLDDIWESPDILARQTEIISLLESYVLPGSARPFLWFLNQPGMRAYLYAGVHILTSQFRENQVYLELGFTHDPSRNWLSGWNRAVSLVEREYVDLSVDTVNTALSALRGLLTLPLRQPYTEGVRVHDGSPNMRVSRLPMFYPPPQHSQDGGGTPPPPPPPTTRDRVGTRPCTQHSPTRQQEPPCMPSPEDNLVPPPPPPPSPTAPQDTTTRMGTPIRTPTPNAPMTYATQAAHRHLAPAVVVTT